MYKISHKLGILRYFYFSPGLPMFLVFYILFYKHFCKRLPAILLYQKFVIENFPTNDCILLKIINLCLSKASEMTSDVFLSKFLYIHFWCFYFHSTTFTMYTVLCIPLLNHLIAKLSLFCNVTHSMFLIFYTHIKQCFKKILAKVPLHVNLPWFSMVIKWG